MNTVPFESWADVLEYAKTGEPLYYSAPMDRFPARLMPGGNAPFTYKAQARTIKIWPAGSTGRGRNRTSDPFTADAGHLDRFSRPEEALAEGRRMTVRERHTREASEEEAFDFDDADAVLAEIAEELDIDVDELEIDANSSLEGFGACDVYEVRIKHSRHGKSWSVVENDEAARDLAIAIVKQDLEEEPGNFNQSFIEQHINMRRLKDDLESDVEQERRDYYEDIARDDPERFWEEAAQYGVELPEEDEDDEDEDDEDPEPSDEDIETVVEESTKELLKDPMAYLEEIYGSEAAAKAIEIAGIDVDAAAEEAVSADGEGHFLSHYDGNTHTTPSGLVYWRDN